MKRNYNLTYKDLVVGECYTTWYSQQGCYTFQFGYHLWYSHIHKTIMTKNSRFVPDNGFVEFCKATEDEKDHLFGGVMNKVVKTMKLEIGI